MRIVWNSRIELQQVLYGNSRSQSYSRSCTELRQLRKSRTELQQVLYGTVRTVRIELQQLLLTATAATPKDIKKAKAGNGKKYTHTEGLWPTC